MLFRSVDSKASKITFQGEFRYRSYLEFGQTSGGADRDGWFNDSRVRLGFGYDFSKDVSAYAEVQDHFTYGDNGSSSGTADNTGFGGGGGGGFSTAGPGGKSSSATSSSSATPTTTTASRSTAAVGIGRPRTST